MGKRGPAPTPTKTLKLRGSWRAKAREGEPQPEAGIPPMPAWLSARGKECWRWLVKNVSPGMVTKLDRLGMAMLCEAYGGWRADPQNERTFMQLLRLMDRFGLTPAARASLKVLPTKEKPKDDKGRFFSKAGAG